MRANVGDRIVNRDHRVAESDRDPAVLDVRGADRTAPSVPRWGAV